MQSFLKDVDRLKRKDQNHSLRSITVTLRELIFEAEDILEDCQLQSTDNELFSIGWLTCINLKNIPCQYLT
jgi:hypothetical protein